MNREVAEVAMCSCPIDHAKKLLFENPVYYISTNSVRRENVSAKTVPNILPIQLIDNSSLLYNTRSISLFVLYIFMGLYIYVYMIKTQNCDILGTIN